MEISYWQSRWKKKKIGWHLDEVYPLLPKVWPQISVNGNDRVLVPLCGKSLDMIWLAEQGCHVTGVEVSPRALREFRERSPSTFTESNSHGFTVYKSEHIELWEGDFLKFPSTVISRPDVIYDKAALVALPPELRSDYAHKVRELCREKTKILLQTFDYVQEEMNGPPFSVPEQEVRDHFGDRFELTLMHEQSKLELLNKFRRRGLTSQLKEKVYLLEPR